MSESHEGKPHFEEPRVPEEEERMSIGRYLLTRVSTLVPPMNPAPNPIKALMLLNRQNWLFFLVSVGPRDQPI
jgi:SHS family lactate transporter-like MFS transporter